MASDKVQLEAAGARILNADGKLVLADTGDACDCACDEVDDCLCDVVDLASYLVEVSIIGGCGGCLPDTCFGDTLSVEVFNSASAPPGSYCSFGANASCTDSDDTLINLGLVNDPTLGCIWLLTVEWLNQIDPPPDPIACDVYTGYRLKASGITGTYTAISGCAAGAATVS